MAKTHARREPSEDVAIRVDGRQCLLSPEERRIILLIVSGYTNQDMARKFSLDASTISRRTARILGKLGVANKLELVLFVLHDNIMSHLLENRPYLRP